MLSTLLPGVYNTKKLWYKLEISRRTQVLYPRNTVQPTKTQLSVNLVTLADLSTYFFDETLFGTLHYTKLDDSKMMLVHSAARPAHTLTSIHLQLHHYKLSINKYFLLFQLIYSSSIPQSNFFFAINRNFFLKLFMLKIKTKQKWESINNIIF